MRTQATLTLLVFGALNLTACADDSPLSPENSLREQMTHGYSNSVTVMTRNLYIGADVDPIIEAAAAGHPELIPDLVDQAFQTMLFTNYPERAGAIADEIAAANPDLIGLQEVYVISVGDLVIDFLDILQQQLAARGLYYNTAGVVENTAVVVPGGQTGLVSLVDYDVVLARADVETDNAVGRNYVTEFPPFQLGGQELQILRGFVAVDAVVGGRRVRFVNTHPEPGQDLAAQIRQGQIAELVAYLADEDLPVIVVGDMNTDGYSREPGYVQLIAAGYQDAWVRFAGSQDPGFTSSHAADLTNETAEFYHRIDLILASRLGWAEAEIVGEEDSDRFQTSDGYWLWPSDHAGVIGRLHIPAQPDMVAQQWRVGERGGVGAPRYR